MDEVTIHAPQPEAIEPTADQIMAECVAVQSEGRRWLKSITAFVAARKSEPDDSKMVQTASDAAMAAAYDRAARILRSDDPIGD
jgi:hypothetical protein